MEGLASAIIWENFCREFLPPIAKARPMPPDYALAFTAIMLARHRQDKQQPRRGMSGYEALGLVRDQLESATNNKPLTSWKVRTVSLLNLPGTSAPEEFDGANSQLVQAANNTSYTGAQKVLEAAQTILYEIRAKEAAQSTG